MDKSDNCRICSLERNYFENYVHFLYSKEIFDIFCPLCREITNVLTHVSHRYNQYLQCYKCNDYVLKIYDNALDEEYLYINNILLVRGHINKSIIYVENKFVLETKYIDCQSREALVQKLKTLILFS